MRCPNCKVEIDRPYCIVQIDVKIPLEKLRHLSKKDFGLKSVQLISANWDSSKFICPNCYFRGELSNFYEEGENK